MPLTLPSPGSSPQNVSAQTRLLEDVSGRMQVLTSQLSQVTKALDHKVIFFPQENFPKRRFLSSDFAEESY
jgi:hypothetical protein